jgi:hypothetical protein
MLSAVRTSFLLYTSVKFKEVTDSVRFKDNTEGIILGVWKRNTNVCVKCQGGNISGPFKYSKLKDFRKFIRRQQIERLIMPERMKGGGLSPPTAVLLGTTDENLGITRIPSEIRSSYVWNTRSIQPARCKHQHNSWFVNLQQNFLDFSAPSEMKSCIRRFQHQLRNLDVTNIYVWS